MGKQDPSTGSTSRKVLDAPCSDLYQASLKCEPCSSNGLTSIICVGLPPLSPQMVCWALLSAGLDQNNYSREACVEHYKAYKNCKQQEVHSRMWLHSTGPKHFCRPCCISCLAACRLGRARSADSRRRRVGKAGSPEQCG